MTFSTPEREFLRLAAMAQPDWQAMRQIAITALDYGVLRRTALLHQLDGVVAWRLIDERLEGVVPELVRQRSQSYLDWLHAAQYSVWNRFDQCCLKLKEVGIRFAVTSGPIQYAMINIPYCPREWRNIHIELEAKSEADMERAAKLIGGEAFKHFPAWYELTLSDLVIDISSSLKPWETNAPIAWDKVSTVKLMGFEWPVLSPAEWIAYMAYDTWKSYTGEATRLSIWQLARLENWAVSYPEWLLDAERVLAGYESTTPPGKPELSDVARIAWVLKMAARVYGIELPSLPETKPALKSYGHHFRGGRQREVIYHEIDWKDNLSDEALLFDMSEGIEARQKAGIWGKRRGAEKVHFREDGYLIKEKLEHA